MRRVLVIALAGTLLAACSHGGASGTSNTTPGFTASSSSPGAAADQVADAYNHDVDAWITEVKGALPHLEDYPKQISLQHDSAAQMAAQKTACSTAQRTLTKVTTPPVLDDAPDKASSLRYKTAVNRDATLRTHAKAVQVRLNNVVRFCTWLSALESGQTAANAANASLFSQPLRYTATITVKNVSHTCQDGTSCYTPDQSLWSRIATLWQKQGAATAQGAKAIRDGHIPCLVDGWDAMCELVVNNQLAYEDWADEYAKAFEDDKNEDLPTANAAISKVAAKFTTEVLLQLSGLPGIYRQLAPGQKYDARVSTTGENIWLAHLKDELTALKAAMGQL